MPRSFAKARPFYFRNFRGHAWACKFYYWPHKNFEKNYQVFWGYGKERGDAWENAAAQARAYMRRLKRKQPKAAGQTKRRKWKGLVFENPLPIALMAGAAAAEPYAIMAGEAAAAWIAAHPNKALKMAQRAAGRGMKAARRAAAWRPWKRKRK